MFFHLHAMFRARKHPYRIEWVPDRVAWPVEVRSLGDLREITIRQQREVRHAIGRHWAVLFSYGGVGKVALPGIAFTRILRPVVETLGGVLALVGIVLGFLPWQAFVILLLATCVLGTINSMLAVVLREFVVETTLPAAHLMKLFVAAIPENFGYRQLRNFWLIAGLFSKARPEPKKQEPRDAPIGRSAAGNS